MVRMGVGGEFEVTKKDPLSWVFFLDIWISNYSFNNLDTLYLSATGVVVP